VVVEEQLPTPTLLEVVVRGEEVQVQIAQLLVLEHLAKEIMVVQDRLAIFQLKRVAEAAVQVQ
jgi:hypothetical protein